MSTRQAARYLVGRRIASVDLRAFDDPNGEIYDPIITFDDGSTLRFVTQETDNGGSYGVALIRTKAKRGPKR